MIVEVRYLEKPVSADEKSIARVIESFLEGRKRGDINALRRCLSDSACIEVEGGGKKLAIEEFLEYVREYSPTIYNLRYRDLLIRIKSSHEAVASYTCHRQHFGSNRFSVSWRLLRFTAGFPDRQWHITDSTCIN